MTKHRCETCNGTGRYPAIIGGLIMYPCPDCQGTGIVDSEVNK